MTNEVLQLNEQAIRVELKELALSFPSCRVRLGIPIDIDKPISESV